MKKLILATLLVAGSLATANAQPHSILLYGNVGFSTHTDEMKNNNMNWQVNPGIGYQFHQNWTVGLDLMWGQSSSKADGDTARLTDNMYHFGAFLRYQHPIMNSNMFFWIGQLNVGYQGQYTTLGSLPSYNKANGIYANVIPMLGMNLGSGFALNFQLGGIGISTMKQSDVPAGVTANTATNFDLTFGQYFMFGLTKNFGCGHHMHGHHEPGMEMRHMDTSDDSSDDDAAPKKGHKKHHSNDDDE